MLIALIISILLAIIIGKLKIKDIQKHVRKYKEKILTQKGRQEDKNRVTGNEDNSTGRDCCER